jgi:hypothetical protein
MLLKIYILTLSNSLYTPEIYAIIRKDKRVKFLRYNFHRENEGEQI